MFIRKAMTCLLGGLLVLWSAVALAGPGDLIDIFVPEGSGGLNYPEKGIVFGPDGNLYVADTRGNNILRYDGVTGAFIDSFASGGGLSSPWGIVFGPDGNLFVANLYQGVQRYDGVTGTFIDSFPRLFPDCPSENQFLGMTVGPDANLYVGRDCRVEVLRFDGSTGAFLDTFPFTSGGDWINAQAMAFGPDGNLYISDCNNDAVQRFDGATGAFIDSFVSLPGGDCPSGLVFGPDGHLYVGGERYGGVFRFDGITGAFIDDFTKGATVWTKGLVFGSDRNLYALSRSSVLRFEGPEFVVRIDVPQGIPQECQQVGGTNVQLQASFVADPSNPVLTREWYLDDYFLGVGVEITPFVELGNHDIRVVITTQSGEEFLGYRGIEIVDTQEPDLEVRFLDRQGNPITTVTRSGMNFVKLDLTASDVCDPSPTVEAFGGVELVDGQLMRIQASTDDIILESSLLEVSVSVEDESGNRAVQKHTLVVVD